MVVIVKVCGVYITKRVPVSLAAGSVFSIIAGVVFFWMQSTADCFDDDEWFDWRCSAYKSRLIIYGSTCLVMGVILLLTASYMLYKLRGATRTISYIQADPAITVVQDGYGFKQQTTTYQPQSQMIYPQHQQQQQQQPTSFFNPQQETFSSQKSSYYS